MPGMPPPPQSHNDGSRPQMLPCAPPGLGPPRGEMHPPTAAGLSGGWRTPSLGGNPPPGGVRGDQLTGTGRSGPYPPLLPTAGRSAALKGCSGNADSRLGDPAGQVLPDLSTRQGPARAARQTRPLCVFQLLYYRPQRSLAQSCKGKDTRPTHHDASTLLGEKDKRKRQEKRIQIQGADASAGTLSR